MDAVYGREPLQTLVKPCYQAVWPLFVVGSWKPATGYPRTLGISLSSQHITALSRCSEGFLIVSQQESQD
jgi:hypothetical protein